LQEVDRGVQRTQRIDEIVELSKLTRMDYAFAFNLPYQGGQYGVAILSRFPIRATEHRLYKNLREAERRGFIRVEVKIDGRVVNFVTTHLDYQHDDGRLFEAQQMLASFKRCERAVDCRRRLQRPPHGPNVSIDAECFDDAWVDGRGTGEGFSYPADKLTKRIDYIFTRRTDEIKTKRAWLINTLASDHVPVVADLELSQNHLR